MPTGSKIDQKLREVEAALATGLTVNQAVRQVGISKLTYYRSRKFAKEEVEEEEVSRPTGSKKSPVVALGLSLGVPIGFALSYVPIFVLTYNTGIPFFLLPIPFALLDGSGQFYNGQVGKGCGFAGLGLGFYVLIFAVGTRLGMSGWGPDLFGMGVPFVGVLARLTSYVWASVDAYRSAKRINVERGWTINVPGGRRFGSPR